MFDNRISEDKWSIKSTKSYLLTISLIVFLLTSGSLFALPQFFTNETVKSGLHQPISMAFLPDNRMLVAQKTGQIFLLDPQQTIPDLLPYLTISDINTTGERGLLDIVIDPDFPVKPFIYVVYHRDSDKRMFISRFTHDGNTASLASEYIVWQDPALFSDINHQGGGLSFGPDGYIYLTTGEQFNKAIAQDLSKAGGKIIRVARDGTIPFDNPFVDGPGGNLDEIWAYGLRNPFRARWDIPISGSVGPRLFIGEVGGNDNPTSYEDIHIGKPGVNYGWPFCEGFNCNNSSQLYDQPLFTYDHHYQGIEYGAAVIGGIVYHGAQFPQSFENTYFYGDYVRQYIRYLTFDSNGEVLSDNGFASSIGLIVDLKEGKDGALYYLQIVNGSPTNTGAIKRITFNDGNQAPHITSAVANPVEGNAPLTVQFSGVATDVENDSLDYTWHFGDGQQSTGNSVSHTYTRNGSYQAYLQVSDGGKTTTLETPLVITVGSKPNVTLQQPANGSTFRAGDIINFSAAANDSDGFLTENNYKWTVLLIHNEHTHPEFDLSGSFGSFEIPSTGHSFYSETGFEITVEVTDSDGLIATKTVSIFPEKVDVTFNSQPNGIPMFFDEELLATPVVYDNIIDFKSVITAPQTTCLNGTQYNFVNWTNGSSASDIYIFPDHDETITAIYTMNGSCNSNSNSAPFAFADQVTVAANTGQLIQVLNNDIDSDGNLEKSSVVINSQPQFGSISINSVTGDITYIHGGGGATSDSFTYTVKDNDGATSNEASVTINLVANSCGNSIFFDGTDDWINIPNFELTGAFTIEAWIKFAHGVDNLDVLVGQEGAGQDINFYNGQIRLFDGADKITGNSGISAGEWTHVALTRSNNNTLTAYINGVEDATSNWSGAFIPKAIGRGNRSFLGMYGGEMDEVRLWNIARSESEINQNFDKTNVSGAGLIGYWDFDEGGQVIQDSSSLGNNGSLGSNTNSSNDDPIRVISDVPVEGGCGTILTPVPRPVIDPSLIIVDEFYNGNAVGSWVVQQASTSTFSYSVTPEKITMIGGPDNQNLTRLNTAINPNRAYSMYSKFKIKTNGGIQSYAMHFLQDDQATSDQINSWTLNLDLAGGGQVKHMGFNNGSFFAIGGHPATWAQANKEYIFQIDVNRRKNGSFSPNWVTGKISTLFGTVLDHFEVDYSNFPWQPDLTGTVRIGLNSHRADWEARDLIVWYTDVIVQNHFPIANAGDDQIVTDSNNNGSETIALDGSLSTDQDGDNLTYDWSENSISLGSGQSINHSFNVGVHTVTLKVNDGNGHDSTDIVKITINSGNQPINIPPVALPDVASVNSGNAVTINVLANDTDSDGTLKINSLVVSISPNSGAVSIDTNTGEVTYTHDGSTSTTDSFSYTVADNLDEVSNQVVVSINITPEAGTCSTSGLDLDGINDWVNIPDISLSNDFTIEGWVNLAAGIDNLDAMFGQEGQGPDINFYAGKVRLYSFGDKVVANTAIQANTWNHIAITRLGSDLKLYINGIEDATGTWSDTLTLKAIGRGNRGYFKGLMDEIRVWNIARTNIEISASFNTDVLPSTLGLIGYWNFNSTDQTVFDTSNSGNHGSLGANSAAGADDPSYLSSTVPIIENCIDEGGGTPPVAFADTATIQTGGVVTINVLANDSSSNSTLNKNSLISSVPNSGTVDIDFVTGEITYSHDGSASNSDSFTYTVADNFGVVSNQATVSITIMSDGTTGESIGFDGFSVGTIASGIITDSSGFIFEDLGWMGPRDIEILGIAEGYINNVIQNSSYGRIIRMRKAGAETFNLNSFDYAAGHWGTEMDALVTAFFHDGTTTSITVNSNTKTMATQVVNWNDLDKVEFNYRGGNTDAYGVLDNFSTGTGSISGGNNKPIVQADVAIVQSGATVIVNVLANDTDSDGTLNKSSLIASNPNSGTVDINFVTGEITYSHDGSASTSDSFTYTVADNLGLVSNLATVSITITNDGSTGELITFDNFSVGTIAPGIITDSSGFIFEDAGWMGPRDIEIFGAAEGYTSNVIQNSSYSRIIRMRKAGAETFNLNSFDYAVGLWGTEMDALVTAFFHDGTTTSITVNSNTKTMATQVVNWNDLDKVEFNYRGGNTDAYGVLDNFSTGTGSIGGGNNKPIVQADVAEVQSGAAVIVNVLANDTDSDGTLNKSSLIASNPNSGTVDINFVTGEITYTHDGSASTSDSFTYTVADNLGLVSNLATVSITITNGGSTGELITFDNFSVGTIASGIITDSSGFIFEDAGWMGPRDIEIFGAAEGYTSNVIQNSSYSRIIRMRKADTETFNLNSFDYAVGLWGTEMDALVTVFFHDGTTASITVNSNTKTMATQVVNWNDLDKVEFNYRGGNTDAYGVLDNFVTH